jgi:hypothetical protein
MDGSRDRFPHVLIRAIAATVALTLLLSAADPTPRFLGLPRLPRLAKTAKTPPATPKVKVRKVLPVYELPAAECAPWSAPLATLAGAPALTTLALDLVTPSETRPAPRVGRASPAHLRC